MNEIGQLIGFIYLGVFIFSFQIENKKGLMKCQMISKIFSTIHYLLIGATSGAVSQFVAIFSSYFSYKYESKKNKTKLIATIFILIFIILGILSFHNGYDLLPIIGSILTIIAIFQKKAKYIRLFQFIISPLFLTYNIVNHSYAGIITELFVIISCLIAVWRLDRTK